MIERKRSKMMCGALAAAVSWIFCAAADPTEPVGADQRPEYPMYSPLFGGDMRFTGEDIRRMAAWFDFVYGWLPDREDMDQARAINPDLRFIQYVGNWSVGGDRAEPELRRDILYYRVAVLAGAIDARHTELQLAASPDDRPFALRASTTDGDVSVSGDDYVTWIRVDDELMRLESVDREHLRVKVTRGFGGTVPAPHAAGRAVAGPVYNRPPGRGGPRYLYDPAYPQRWELVRERLFRAVEDGGDGVWIDILMSTTLNPHDIDGTLLWQQVTRRAPGVNDYWDTRTGAPYTYKAFRQYSEIGVKTIQDAFFEEHRRFPVLYGNNMMAPEFDALSGNTRTFMLSTPEKPVGLDGMCVEDCFGGYGTEEWRGWRERQEAMPPPKATLGSHGYKNWMRNVQMLMACAQSDLPAVPLIINAGMKTATFEAIDPEAKHAWELWAYAGYLLTVERRNGHCPTKLGVPMLVRRDGRRRVELDSMYFHRIGAPAETHAPELVHRYRLPGTMIFARRFEHGLVLVNPDEQSYSVDLDTAYLDPDTGAVLRHVDMAAQSGRILLAPPATP